MIIAIGFTLLGCIGYFFYHRDWKIIFLGLMVGIGVSFIVGEIVVEKYPIENKKYVEITTNEVRKGKENLWIYCFYTAGGKCFKKTVIEK